MSDVMTKSMARNVFYGGSLFFIAIFGAMSVHSHLYAVNVSTDKAALTESVAAGKLVWENKACINCHTIRGTVADGRYGPDLTHLMSRATIASGVLENNRRNLETWIADPNYFKPGSMMPAMHLNETQNAQIAAYLATLH